MKKIAFSLLILIFTPFLAANTTLTFAVVPQQSASKLAELWTPITEALSKQSGLNIKFATAPDIPTFEKRLSEGLYDIAYMNPYHYIVFHKSNGYQALAKAASKQIKGIIVVAKDSDIRHLSDLNNSIIAFPAPGAFAATILTQSTLTANKVNFTPSYVSSHDSVYLTVAKGIYPAGGGVLRTFNNVDPDIKEQLTILSTTQGYTPHAIATHPRVNTEKVKKILYALSTMDKTESGKVLLKNININSFEEAKNSDWDDIRALNLSVNIIR